MEHELADGKKFFVSAGTEWKQRSCGLKAQKRRRRKKSNKRDRVDGPIGIEEAASGCDVGVMGCELSWSP
jgi:hypothetical protein